MKILNIIRPRRLLIGVMLGIFSLVTAGLLKFFIWMFGRTIDFRFTYWITCISLLSVYLLWTMIYIVLFEKWVEKYRECTARGMSREISEVYAAASNKIKPPIKFAKWLAKNQKFWDWLSGKPL